MQTVEVGFRQELIKEACFSARQVLTVFPRLAQGCLLAFQMALSPFPTNCCLS